jgi:hypothetical protein
MLLRTTPISARQMISISLTWNKKAEEQLPAPHWFS